MTDDLKQHVMRMYEAVLELHGPLNPLPPRRTPMHELISTILSHRTTNADEARAYQSMWQKYGSWDAIREADEDELATAIDAATFPEPKAGYIKGTLEQIYTERGDYDITFLHDLTPQEALDWLMALPGVGIKTASLVLLFNFQMPILPVDTHVHRVSQRVGLIGQKVSTNAAHDVLLKLLPDDPYVLFNFHKGLLRHGQRVCTYYEPKCDKCNMTSFCEWYQSNRMK